MDNIIKVTGQQQERIKLPMCGKDREAFFSCHGGISLFPL